MMVDHSPYMSGSPTYLYAFTINYAVVQLHNERYYPVGQSIDQRLGADEGGGPSRVGPFNKDLEIRNNFHHKFHNRSI